MSVTDYLYKTRFDKIREKPKWIIKKLGKGHILFLITMMISNKKHKKRNEHAFPVQ